MTCDITFDVSDENMALLHELADLTSEINKNLDRLFRVAELVAGAPKKEAALAVGAAQDGKEKLYKTRIPRFRPGVNMGAAGEPPFLSVRDL